MTEPEQPRLYTRQEAVILGRRAICETGDGHRLGVKCRIRSRDSGVVIATYGCDNCDVQVALSYPPLPGDTLG